MCTLCENGKRETSFRMQWGGQHGALTPTLSPPSTPPTPPPLPPHQLQILQGRTLHGAVGHTASLSLVGRKVPSPTAQTMSSHYTSSSPFSPMDFLAVVVGFTFIYY